jgi:hypothetical protein
VLRSRCLPFRSLGVGGYREIRASQENWKGSYEQISIESFVSKISFFFNGLLFHLLLGFLRDWDFKVFFQEGGFSLKKDLAAIEKEIEDLKNDDFYYEKIAREDFIMGRRDETIYKF